MLCDSTARWAGVLFVSWAGIHYKREIIDDWMCPPTMFWTHWRNRNCAKTSRLKMLISVFHLTREIVPTTEHRWNCLTKTWLAKFRNSSSKNSNLHVIYDKTYRKNFWFLVLYNKSWHRELKGPIYRKGQTGGNERWLGINENTTRTIRCRP